MAQKLTRRETFRNALAAISAITLVNESALPALAAGESEVAFTDIPSTFSPTSANSLTRYLDIRKIDGQLTPKDQFFAIQHKNQPVIDPATYKLKLSGLVKKEASLTLAELKAMKPLELTAAYECSGNSPRAVQGLSSCGHWTGVRLSDVLKKIGVDPAAREVVFFGNDHSKEDVVFRAQTFGIDQQFGRSITLENAMKPEPMLVWALNGEPLTVQQGAPVRLLMPGWYGVANVKWLAEIHLQEDRYLGNYQARWYRSLKGFGGSGADLDPETQWVENEITHMMPKSVIARVRKGTAGHEVLGFVLNDGSPVRSVEVKVDGGPWQPATLDPANTRFSWKLFTYKWNGASAGAHTLVSRVTEASGKVQPTSDELKTKKTFLQDNGQFARKVMVS